MRLFDIYRGAELPTSVAQSLGESAGSFGLQRGVLLADLVNQHKLRVQDLSPQDVQLAGANLDTTHPGETQGGSALRGIGGFFSHLGSDVWTAARGLPVGLFKTGEAIGYDALHPFTAFGGFGSAGKDQPSHIYRDVVKPQGQYLKQQYGQGNVFDNFYQHPLGPILDVATVASLGAGGAGRLGSTLSRAGKISDESLLARIGRTSGREALRPNPSNLTPEEGVVPEIARDYSARPLRKGLQVLTDKAGERLPLIQKGQIWASTTGMLKKGSSIKDSEAMQRIARQVQPLIPVLKDLTPHETQAFDLINRGINSPQSLDAYEMVVQSSRANQLPNELKANATDYGRAVNPEIPAMRANIAPEVKSLVVDPTQSDRLMTAIQAYRNAIHERISPDLAPEDFTAKANELRTSMHDVLGGPVDYNPDHPFPEPTIMPSQVATGFKQAEPGPVAQFFGKEAGWQKETGPFTPSAVTQQNVLAEPYNTFRPHAQPLLAGVQRPDLRQYADLIAKHERDVVEKAYSHDFFNQWALKDQNGDLLTVTTPAEAERKYGKEYTAVHPSAPLRYYREQTTVADAVAYMGEHGVPLDSPEMNALIQSMGEDTAISMVRAARREPAYVVRKDVAEYQRKIENAAAPYESKIGRASARFLNRWRTYTLSLMPRWALNTAVGSFMLNSIKGVGPRSYITAGKLAKSYEESGAVHPSIFEHHHVGGVNLGNQIGMELLEGGMQGGLMGTNRVARGAMHKVQAIEDYFRRASFVNSLSKEAKQALRENGATIAGFEKDRGPRTVDDYRELILNDPNLTQKAVDDVNRFAYNFAMLGPMERRYIRQIAPFWGWYKFISGVVYKLPVDYPGRTNLLARLGTIGMDDQNAMMGQMPAWLMGNIALGVSPGGIMKYFSTAGVNPFSQTFNPLSPEGAGGFVQLGQGSPLIQAGLAAFGVNPMDGSQMAVSPEHGVSPDQYGTLRDERTGAERSVASVSPMARVFASLLRSFPEARIGERIRSGGRSPYPESIPLLYEHYMPTKPETRFGGGMMDALEQMFGVGVRPFNLSQYQINRYRGMLYAMRKGARARAKLRANLKQP